MLTYQTYVRALYARLRSPSQFIWLQALSSGFLIVLVPVTMTRTWHRGLSLLGLTGQSYGAYQKVCVRNVFIRSLAENVSMLTFLGSVLVLHFGANKDVYPRGLPSTVTLLCCFLSAPDPRTFSVSRTLGPLIYRA